MKLSAEVNYHVERPDAFGAEWMVGINISPVVVDVLAKVLWPTDLGWRVDTCTRWLVRRVRLQ